MLCRPAGLPLLVRGYLAFLMLLGSTGSIAYGQATNISPPLPPDRAALAPL